MDHVISQFPSPGFTHKSPAPLPVLPIPLLSYYVFKSIAIVFNAIMKPKSIPNPNVQDVAKPAWAHPNVLDVAKPAWAPTLAAKPTEECKTESAGRIVKKYLHPAAGRIDTGN